ncbi:Asparagine--tRNA ligase [archaeon HR01]|nr:Asparagine--tRNA ligase [archaeon HR01]
MDSRLGAGKVTSEFEDREVSVSGWVQEIRDLGKIVFIVLRDATGICQIKVLPSKAGRELADTLKSITQESVITVRGRVVKEPRARLGVEIEASDIVLLSRAVSPLPYDVTGKVGAGMRARLENRILDLRKPENRSIFTLASSVSRALREFFYSEGFTEVRTPRIIATSTEGGAELFEVNYFGRPAYLAQSPQLYKEELVTVFEKVFEIGPFFRAEPSHTGRHVSEFTSVDIEAAFMDMEDVMKILERAVSYVYQWVLEKNRGELKTLGVELKPPKTPFKRLTYTEAVETLRALGEKIEWGEDFGTAHLRALGKKYRGFYFITGFPAAVKPFYIQPSWDNPEISESFDLMYQWLELASGGTRISDRGLLEKRLAEKGLKPESFREHLKVYEYGMPFHAGWGLGFERLMMVITRRTNIRDVILFPRDRFRLTP